MTDFEQFQWEKQQLINRKKFQQKILIPYLKTGQVDGFQIKLIENNSDYPNVDPFGHYIPQDEYSLLFLLQVYQDGSRYPFKLVGNFSNALIFKSTEDNETWRIFNEGNGELQIQCPELFIIDHVSIYDKHQLIQPFNLYFMTMAKMMRCKSPLIWENFNSTMWGACEAGLEGLMNNIKVMEMGEICHE